MNFPRDTDFCYARIFMYLENCIQREISYENKRVELIQQDIRGNVNNIIKKQTITNACNAIHVWRKIHSRGSDSFGYADKSVWWMPWH